MPFGTIYITGGVVFVFALNYATMGYVYAMVVEALNVLSWAYLLKVALADRRNKCA